jgi:hypothetical protein
MTIRIEVEFDDNDISVAWHNQISHTSPEGSSSAAIMDMARCVEQVIAALETRSNRSFDTMVDEFCQALTLSRPNRQTQTKHSCDGVGCC